MSTTVATDRHPVSTATLRGAGVCAIVTTIVYLIAGILHGTLTAGGDQSSSETVFEHVNATPAWGPVNIVMLLATIGWLAVFVAINDLPGGGDRTAWLGRLSTLALAFGIAAATLLYLADAIAIPQLAQQWAQAAPVEQAQIVATGDTVQNALRIPLFHTLPMFVLGLPFALLGLAHVKAPSSELPTWTAWLALIGGAAAFLMGLSWSLGTDFVPETMLWAVVQPLIWIWGISTGVSLLRRASSA
ncbi:hypothetical protein [Pseudonocardia sp. NPDC049635]|uniref:hypothetical protein n=1 Tax=Pseudonocardia sp. NPDC049635 TaxID=3155506 RepID=UPI0033DD04C3